MVKKNVAARCEPNRTGNRAIPEAAQPARPNDKLNQVSDGRTSALEYIPSVTTTHIRSRLPARRALGPAAFRYSTGRLCAWLAGNAGLRLDVKQRYGRGDPSYMDISGEPAEGCYFQGPLSFTNIDECICYGKACVEGVSNVYELIPIKWMSRVDNPDDVIGMLVFDLWMGSNRHRSEIYLDDGEHIHIVFLSHNEMFYHNGGQIYYKCPNTNIEELVWFHEGFFDHVTAPDLFRWATHIHSSLQSTLEDGLRSVDETYKPPRFDESVKAFLYARSVDFDENVSRIIYGFEEARARYEARTRAWYEQRRGDGGGSR